MMRPKLDQNTNPEIFLEYYWLKEELTTFCRQHNLSGLGSKQEITQRIYAYLKTEKIQIAPQVNSHRKQKCTAPLNLDARIPEGYKNDERHRVFFKSVIGEQFKCNVPFMNWMKNNPGKIYADACAEWIRIRKEKHQGKKTEISSQFQYNQYTRDFFNANPKGKKEEAITCWNYKKSLPGPVKYEQGDLAALT